MSAFLSFILPWMERAGNDVFQGDSTMNSLQNSFSGINIRAILCHPHFSNTLLAFYTPHKGHFYCFPGSFSYTKYNDLVMQLGISKNFKKKKESALTMRKQTKIAAVVSAAALLALGASITSFAAQKGTWKYEDGEWYCYDKDGYVHENTFCLSNGKEFYVGNDGALVRSSWVEDGNDWYFVNSAGEKITNDWRLTTPYDDENAEEEWFYFQSTGKMATDKKLVIKGKTYFFDTDGQMLTGWVQENDGTYIEASTSVDANPDTYYCDETGARVTSNWVWDYAPGVDEDDTEEEEHYFYLKSNGKVQTDKASNIKGQTYLFDVEGKMLTGWVAATTSNADDKTHYTSIENSEDETLNVNLHTVDGSVYYCTPEDGHVKKNKWIKLWKPSQAYEQDEDKSKKWFYLNKNGEVYIPSDGDATEIATKYSFEEGQLVLDDDNEDVEILERKINGKDYHFNMDGEMITGFWNKEDVGLIYLGGSNDGIMKTGAQTIKDDVDDSYRFYFGTSGSSKGVGFTGNKSGKLYYDGMLITAKDYRYELAEVNDRWFIINQSGSIQHSATQYKEDGSVLIDAKKDEKLNYVDADFYKSSDVDDSGEKIGDAYEYSIKGGKDALNDVDTNVINALSYVYRQ